MRLTGFYWARLPGAREGDSGGITAAHWRGDTKVWHIVGSDEIYYDLVELGRIEDWEITQARRCRKLFRIEFNGTFLGGTAIVAADSPSEAIKILKDSDVQTPREPITATALDTNTAILYINNGDYANAAV